MNRTSDGTSVAAGWPVSRSFYCTFTAAVTGAAIMVIEIVGAKILAPYVGSSHFVWTAQIMVTLAALATGYYAGGRWADRASSLTPLYLTILAAAVILCGLVTQVERIAYACLDVRLSLGSLLASGVLFFVPLALLAMTNPFLIRGMTSSLGTVGSGAGRLAAVSTLGSVAGTLLVGYVLIPLLPNAMTLILTGMILLLVAAGWLVFRQPRPGPRWAAALALAIGCGCAAKTTSIGLLQSASYHAIYRGNSNFGQLEVFESRTLPYRYLLNDGLTQGALDTRTRQGLGSWLCLLHELACAYTPRVNDVLAIGLGIGAVPMQFAQDGARVDVAEINPVVIPLAQQYFHLQPERMNIVIGDGRQFLQECRKEYDVIVLDAFLGDSTPSHLMTREAFAEMRRVLRPEGVLVINCTGSVEPGRDFLMASLQKTLGQVFAGVELRARKKPGRVVNVLIVASPSALTLRRQPDFDSVHPSARRFAEELFTGVVEADAHHGIVLTDNYNPVDYYDAANREQARRAMVTAMQALENEGTHL